MLTKICNKILLLHCAPVLVKFPADSKNLATVVAIQKLQYNAIVIIHYSNPIYEPLCIKIYDLCVAEYTLTEVKSHTTITQLVW